MISPQFIYKPHNHEFMPLEHIKKLAQRAYGISCLSRSKQWNERRYRNGRQEPISQIQSYDNWKQSLTAPCASV
jgi:hypothetical protein